MNTPVSLVFVSTNEGMLLIEALASLFASKPARKIEVLVVDNASNDGAHEQIAERWPEVRVLRRDSPHGLPSNLNCGIVESNSPYVMLCNSDLIFAPGSVDTLGEFLDEHPRAGIVAPKLLDPAGEARPSARRWYSVGALLALKGPWRELMVNREVVRRSVYADWDYSTPRQVDWVPCPATMIRRAALDEVGLMDERFKLYFDDVDISFRMHEAEWEVWCVPASEVIHIEQRASVRLFSRPWRWHLVSLLRFMAKHKRLKPRSPSNRVPANR